MKTPRCPRCDRIDATAKVTAIVNKGTSYSDSSRTSASPSLADDEIDWSFKHESSSSTSQTALARQLSFPDKAGTAMVAGWWIFFIVTFFLFAWYLVRSDIQDNVSPSGANQKETESLELLNFLVGAATVVAVGALVMALIATPIHVSGRAKARRVWETLYYCHRDDIVYSADNPTRRQAPLSAMRQVLHY